MSTHHAQLIACASPLEYQPKNISPQLEYRIKQVGIDTVRALVRAAQLRPEANDSNQTLLVATEFITEEAQQALLKIIEEPPLSTKFIFLLPQGYTLLPTLESRFQRVVIATEPIDSSLLEAFMGLDYGSRLQLIDEVLKKKDIPWQTAIKHALVGYLERNHRTLSDRSLADLEYVARMLLTRGASNKFLLEQLALLLPVQIERGAV